MNKEVNARKSVINKLFTNFLINAYKYYLKDVAEVGVIAATSYSAVAHIPWTIKPIFGIISDGFPILGRHRNNYIITAAVIGTSAWVLLGTIQMDTFVAVFFMLCGNFSLAVPEVRISRSSNKSRYVTLQKFHHSTVIIFLYISQFVLLFS